MKGYYIARLDERRGIDREIFFLPYEFIAFNNNGIGFLNYFYQDSLLNRLQVWIEKGGNTLYSRLDQLKTNGWQVITVGNMDECLKQCIDVPFPDKAKKILNEVMPQIFNRCQLDMN